MKALYKIRGRVWLILMLCAFMVSLSFAVRFARMEMDRVRRLTQTRKQLQSLIAESRRQLSYLTETVSGEVMPPERLFAEGIGRNILQIAEHHVTELPEGFRRHALRLSVKDLPLSGLESLLQRAENSDPAWHVREIKLSPREGSLQGELLLEALDKSAPAL